MNIIQLPASQIEKQRCISTCSFDEMGCSTENCENTSTHIAYVEVKLINGRELFIIRTYCATCIIAVRAIGIYDEGAKA